MPQNHFKPKGPVKSSKADAGGSNIYTTPVFGIVKDIIDPTRAGRIKVFIGEPGAKDSNNPSSWLTVKLLSSFFGKVEPTAPQQGLGTYKENSSSYGQWQSPPDIGTKVVCVFINGDPNYGYYIGADPDPEALQMVPAIGAAEYIVPNEGEANSFGGATRLPVTNINTNDKKLADSSKYNKEARPIHSYSAAIMSQQGLIRDPIRGPISSSASREPASRVGWGVSTPGRPIYEGGYTDETITQNLEESKSQELRVVSRRGGHSIVMDDGDLIGNDQLIRIRTALGHQITMSDDGQTLFVIHSNGQSYIELGKEGTIDMYATNSVNIRSQGDINFHADQHMNFHAAEKMNFFGKNLTIDSEEEFKLRSGKSISAYALKDIAAKADGSVAFLASKEASLESSGQAFVKGSKVQLNTGKCGTVPKKIDAQQLNAQTDTLFDATTGFSAAPGKLMTITSRTPAHAPWSNAGQGVEAKVNINASSSLPQSSTPAVEQTNNQAAQLGAKPPATATVSSVPAVNATSGAMDVGTSSAVMGAVATNAATGPGQNAVNKGAAISDNGTSCVGSFAIDPTNLSKAGITKPGSEVMINAIAKETGNIQQAYPSFVFSTSPNLESFAGDVGAQTSASSTINQKSQTTLTNAGVLSGRESSGQIAGLITSASLFGVGPTAAAVGQLSGQVGSSLSSNPGLYSNQVGVSAGGSHGQFGDIDVYTVDSGYGTGGDTSNTLKAIALGQAAAGLASTLGGLGGITTALLLSGVSLTALSSKSRGPTTAAYDTIKSSFTPLKPRVPQNLNTKAKNKAATQAASANSTVQTRSIASGIAQNQTSTGRLVISDDITALIAKNSNTAGTINGISGSSTVVSTGQLDELTSAATFVNSGKSGTTSAQLASGVSSIAGGGATFGTVVNNAPNANNSLPGTNLLSGYITERHSSAMNNTTPAISGLPIESGGLSASIKNSMPTGQTAKLESTLSSLSGGTPNATKLPTSGINTFDRSQITVQIDNIIGDPKIPKPTLVGNTKEGEDKVSLSEIEVEETETSDRARNVSDADKKAYEEAVNSYPAGDPRIALAKAKYEASYLKAFKLGIG